MRISTFEYVNKHYIKKGDYKGLLFFVEKQAYKYVKRTEKQS